VKEVLQYGFYHADLHGGNLIILQGGVIGVIDFGMMGELRESDRQSLARLYISAASLDIDGIVEELMRFSVGSSSVNRPRLMRDLDRLFRKYCGLTLQQMHFQEMMQDFTTMMQRHRLVLPSNLWMLAKAMVMMEGLCLKLDPDFDIFAVSEPIVERLKWQMLRHNAEWGKALLRRTADWSELTRLFPRASRWLLEKIEQNQSFDVALSNVDLLLGGFGRLANRLSLSMIIASMVIGLAVLISTTSNGSPIQILIMAGFMGTVVMGNWLMISIFRGR
jgi:ubiquinone biosynthesis protein